MVSNNIFWNNYFDSPIRALRTFPRWEGVLSRFFSTSRNSYTLFSNNPTKPKTTICKLVLIFLSQFFHNLRRFSNHPNDLSTTQRWVSPQIYVIHCALLLQQLHLKYFLFFLKMVRQCNHHQLKHFLHLTNFLFRC